ncbi:MAG: hypothetical protein KAU24_00190 [Candidatus Aenigmarchaeota archaeon]|nr:hypothetical protein [Candidatus Aenigmarchaeota archaeon]
MQDKLLKRFEIEGIKIIKNAGDLTVTANKNLEKLLEETVEKGDSDED